MSNYVINQRQSVVLISLVVDVEHVTISFTRKSSVQDFKMQYYYFYVKQYFLMLTNENTFARTQKF